MWAQIPLHILISCLSTVQITFPRPNRSILATAKYSGGILLNRYHSWPLFSWWDVMSTPLPNNPCNCGQWQWNVMLLGRRFYTLYLILTASVWMSNRRITCQSLPTPVCQPIGHFGLFCWPDRVWRAGLSDGPIIYPIRARRAQIFRFYWLLIGNY